MQGLAIFLVSQATMAASVAVLLYEGYVYNVVFLCRILPALGKKTFAIVFFMLFNPLWMLALWSYLRAHCADPGTIPDEWGIWVKKLGEGMVIAHPRPEWQPGKVTRCRKCDVLRPERAHHCAVCGMCVLRMDHHCPWINNCVGFRNHKFFLQLGIYACCSACMALITAAPELIACFGAIVKMEDGFVWKDSELAVHDIFLFILFGILAVFVLVLLAPLLATHLPLAGENLTTIEDNYENMPNPYDHGSRRANLAQILGDFGLDWFIPILPLRPLSDGVSFPRPDDPLQISSRSSDGGGLPQEELWRIRYGVAAPTFPEQMMGTLNRFFGTN